MLISAVRCGEEAERHWDNTNPATGRLDLLTAAPIRTVVTSGSGRGKGSSSPCSLVLDCGGVETLSAGRRQDMSRISAQEHPAPAHRLGHEGAQRDDGFLDAAPGDNAYGLDGGNTPFEFLPERFVGPVFGFVAQDVLNVRAAEVSLCLEHSEKPRSEPA